MSVNGVEIKVGQVWKSRSGTTWRVTGFLPGQKFPWQFVAESGNDPSPDLYNDEGLPCVGYDDLMFLVSDPDVGVERRKQQTENAPSRRKTDEQQLPADIPDLAAPPDEFAASIPGALDDGARSELIEAIRANPVRELSIPVGVECRPGTISELAKTLGRASSILRGEQPPSSAEILWQKTVVPADTTRTDDGPEIACRFGETAPQSALDVQIGGGHYKQFSIQPVEFIHKNGIGFIEGNCIKYLARWRDKGGVQDLEKVKHYIDLLIEMETSK